MYSSEITKYENLRSIALYGVGLGTGFLIGKFLNELRTRSKEIKHFRKRIRYNLDRIDTFERTRFRLFGNLRPSDSSRYDNFHRMPFYLPVADPVETVVTWMPAFGSADVNERILLSLPGNPPYEAILPDADGNFTLSFTPPATNENTEDTKEVWFECQLLPLNPRGEPCHFLSVDRSQSDETVKVIRLKCEQGILKFVADLEPPYYSILKKLESMSDQIDTTLAVVPQNQVRVADVWKCANDVLRGAGIGAGAGSRNDRPGDRGGALWGAAWGAASGLLGEDCQNAMSQTMEEIGEGLRRAKEAAEEAHFREAADRSIRDARGTAKDMDKMNNAAELHERWERMGRMDT